MIEKQENYQPRTLDELNYWRDAVVSVRVSVLQSLNQIDQVLSSIDDQIGVAKRKLDFPSSRCNFCGVKIRFSRLEEGWKAYELDGSTEHRCLEERTRI